MFAKITNALIVLATIATAGITNSGAILSWTGSDMTKFDAAGQAIASNGFLVLDLLPYIILVGAVVYILNKVLGIFRFGGGAKGK